MKKLVAFCSHFVLMRVVALSAAGGDMEGRKMQFRSMASIKQSSRWNEKTGSQRKQELASPKLFSLKTCAAKKQKNRWRSTYGNLLASDVAECCSPFEIQDIFTSTFAVLIKPRRLVALRPSSHVASIPCTFFHSTWC